MDDDDAPGHVRWRVDQLEKVVETMAVAAASQQEFNLRVERFMASAKTWGIVALMLYGLGQAALVVVISQAIGAGG